MTFTQYHNLAKLQLKRRELWRLFIGIGIIGIGYLISNVAFLLPLLNDQDLARLSASSLESTPRLTLLILLPFLGVVAACALICRLLHKTSISYLFSLRHMPFSKAFVTGAFLAIVVYLLLFFALPSSTEPLSNLDRQSWFYLLFPALVLIAIQSLSEELVFRGYLQPFLAARFASPFVWWFLPSFTFGALHWQQDIFSANAHLVVLSATLMGLILGDITARTGSIALAWGLHFANNCFAMLGIALPGPLSGLALYVVDVNPRDPAEMSPILVGNVATLISVYVVYLIWLRFRRKTSGSFAIFG